MMKKTNLVCPYCDSVFEESRTGRICERCPYASGCTRVRCPYCGTEFNPDSGGFIRFSEEKNGE